MFGDIVRGVDGLSYGGCFGGFSVLSAAVSNLSEKIVIFTHPPLWNDDWLLSIKLHTGGASQFYEKNAAVGGRLFHVRVRFSRFRVTCA